MTQVFGYGFTTNQKQNDYRIAIHEAGHAVVGHLVGVAIDHVALCPDGGGVSSPVRDPAAAAADKLWAEATAISRKLVLADYRTQAAHQ
jgi:hypothetical protein